MSTPSPQPVEAAPPVCRNHPDGPARLLCEKFDQWFCGECAVCPRPTHCKFRTQCLIRELESSDE